MGETCENCGSTLTLEEEDWGKCDCCGHIVGDPPDENPDDGEDSSHAQR